MLPLELIKNVFFEAMIFQVLPESLTNEGKPSHRPYGGLTTLTPGLGLYDLTYFYQIKCHCYRIFPARYRLRPQRRRAGISLNIFSFLI